MVAISVLGAQLARFRSKDCLLYFVLIEMPELQIKGNREGLNGKVIFNAFFRGIA